VSGVSNLEAARALTKIQLGSQYSIPALEENDCVTKSTRISRYENASERFRKKTTHLQGKCSWRNWSI
jgi:hypothetical protein